jgi:two-component system chemotaxis response regulator CheB
MGYRAGPVTVISRSMKVLRNVVVIGGSLGGLKALSVACRELPSGFPALVLVVLHMAANSPKMFATMLGRQIQLPVSYAEDGETPVQGHVYMAPPDRHLIITPEGRLALDPGPKVHFARPAVNRLFETAAAAYGPRVIGVILTGGDHDGADGMAAIRSAGGLCIVQLPSDALDPSMPNAAISKDPLDEILPVDEIGARLNALVFVS